MTRRTEMEELTRELAWSLWGALGVPSVTKRHEDVAVDPEALIAFTSTVADADPRCWDEALGWAVPNERYLSRKRLKLIHSRLPNRARQGTDLFASAVWGSARHGSLATAETFSRSKRESDLKLPAAIRLRARAVLGAGARTEVLFALTWECTDWVSAATLASRTGYTKRNIADELGGLVRAGHVESRASGNRQLYRAARSDAMALFLAPVPSGFTNWMAVLPALAHVSDLVAENEHADATVRAVEATSLLRRLREFEFAPELSQLPEPGSDSWESVIDWSTEMLKAVSAPSSPSA